ncbi:sodium/potassium-transporting ATPase subunit beta-2-like [Tribolium madens]|uniref:sodium/potassium-transporting ATPase subunit beta-2-like n=1 Tax=Tribolium madens TaxID=41895 RepID=UPI001CF75998|nr:sodium/potassium-transporting ATPase subunit beta-2-like [Tribolium madens]
MWLFSSAFLHFIIIGAIEAATPVLEFKPTPAQNDSGLIWFVLQNRTSSQRYIDDLNEFLKSYKEPKPANVQNCDRETPPENHVCDVRIEDLAPCARADDYYFYRGQVCVFLKLRNVSNWVPEFYNSTNLPSDMPLSLKETIRKDDEKGIPPKIWVTCDGETAADKEMIGALDYKPWRGFSHQYFPVINAKNYLSPLVAVHFRRPQFGVLINVECTAWAKNIPRKNKQGIARFGLLLEDIVY